MSFNYGDVLDRVARHRSDEIAISSDAGDLSWADFDARTNALARGLAARGVKPGDKICFLLYNGAPYIELLAACFKGRFVHVNANFRYLTSEIDYILDNSDSVALFYDARMAERVSAIQTKNVALIEVGSAQPHVSGAALYEDLIAPYDTSPLEITRSDDDMLFIYTGGTTGSPKGVMWTHKDHGCGLFSQNYGVGSFGLTTDVVLAGLNAPKTYIRPLIAPPLMHAFGLVTAITTFLNGGQIVVTDNAGRFNAAHHWSLIEKHKVDGLSIIGDSFAKPLLAELERKSYDLSSLKIIGSSGVMWSTPVKKAMLSHVPQAIMFDSLASSEAIGLGSSVLTKEGESKTAAFKISDKSRVIDDDGNDIEPGSGKSGMLVGSGPMPRGYYKDPKKTAETFRVINGQRYTIAGDLCTVERDGTVTFLGRGSGCINSGGEKIFPEEVEEALKTHPDITDALVFGVSDPTWGKAVQAVVNAKGEMDEADIRSYLKTQIAAYKVPKRVIVTLDSIRLANGKADYKAAKQIFSTAVGEP